MGLGPALRHARRCAAQCRLRPLSMAARAPTRVCARPPRALVSVRGKKTTTTLKGDELPQGPIAAVPLDEPDEHAGPVYPTVLQQVRNNMRKFAHCVVITRIGNFYELYFEHAEEYGPLLNIKVSRRRTAAGPVYMAGFPYFQLDRFLKILVQDLNKHVAVSDEIRNNASEKVKSGGLLFDRKVTRIISAGTLIDEKFMDPWENNYCLSIYHEPLTADPRPGPDDRETKAAHQSANVGLAWLDLSSGEFFTQSTSLAGLSSAVARIGPREIVLDSLMRNASPSSRLIDMLEEEHHVITFQEPQEHKTTLDDWVPLLTTGAPDFKTAIFPQVESTAAASLLQYVHTQLQGSGITLQPPVRRQASEYMSIDRNTLRALELRSTLREGKYEGSLLHAIRRTVTKSGTRLLSERLVSPSMSLETINGRLDLVTKFLEDAALRQNLVALLRRTFDSRRLLQKFSMGRGDADDLLELSKTIQSTLDIARLLKDEASSDPKTTGSSLLRLSDRLSLKEPSRLATRILEAIDEEGLTEQHRLEDDEAAAVTVLAVEVLNEEGEDEQSAAISKRAKAKANGKSDCQKSNDTSCSDVWTMRRSASTTLKRLHKALDELVSQREDLAARLRDETGSSTLTLRWTPGLGHIVHVKGKGGSVADLSSVRSVGSSRSTRSYHLPEWTHLGNQMEEAKLRIRAEEQRVFVELRAKVIRNLVRLRRNAAILDELDVSCSFATLAEEKGLIRPILDNSTAHNIVGGRHPVVESSLLEQGRSFTSNSCSVGGDKRILLITGPNMAGKSTFLRQNALISILAQTGSFVPADYAEIGLVDQIFSRVGSADNLYQDQSTFMVEMLETADILKQATPRSFVIMDEVGRGTTPEDGIAVGYACLHHLYNINQCRTLFSTHFHKLADMTSGFEKLACYCTDVEEEDDGSFTYVHRLRNGTNRKSHALKVARVAGLPEEAIKTAAAALKDLELQSQVNTD